MSSKSKITKLLKEAKEHTAKQNYSEAIELYKQALEIDPNNFTILFDLGLTHDACGEYENAIDCLLKIPNMEYDNFTLWKTIGHSYKMLKQYRKSIDAYKKALSFNPDSNNKEMIINIIDNMVLKVDYDNE